MRKFRQTLIYAFACAGVVAIFLGVLEAAGIELEPRKDCVCEAQK